MTRVSIFFFDNDDNFLRRIDAPYATLTPGQWKIWKPTIHERAGYETLSDYEIPTSLTAGKIEESLSDPDTISFWDIPGYIRIMEETGFPATRLSIHFQSLLAQPFLFAAMILLAATFSLRPTRFGGTGIMIVLGVSAGFLIFFMESMLNAFGVSQKIPAYLAAWTPAIVSLLFGASALLHLEDG
jgi:lipopolysaccharide export system permease protein